MPKKKNFFEKAREFLKRRKGVFVGRDNTIFFNNQRRVFVGTGEFKRMAIKTPTRGKATRHGQFAKIIETKLKERIRLLGAPKTFKLVETPGEAIGRNFVQKYWHAPSIEALERYLEAKKHGKKHANLSVEDEKLCKKIVNQHKKQYGQITLDELTEMITELTNHLVRTGHVIAYSNIIVLGKTKNGKFKIAIVDV